MKDLTLTISDNPNSLPRLPLALRLTSKTTNNRSQSNVFSPKLSLIAAIDTTYRAVFAGKKISQTTQIKSLRLRRIPPILNSLAFCQ
jgi:hypothetical protein